MNDEYEIVEQAPTVEQYMALCTAVGWEPFFDPAHVSTALDHSLHHALALHRGEVVGMGRVVGDRAIFFYLHDVAVHPGHQGRGLGRRIVTRLLDRIRETAPRPAHVYLFTAEGAAEFYKGLGFTPLGNTMYLGLERSGA